MSLFWNRAQIGEGGNGGTVQQRGQGRLEVCNERSTIVSTRQEEFLLQSTVTWELLWVQKKGQLSRFPENEGRIAQAWVNVRGGLRIFSVYFWHSEGWSSRNEALLEAVLKRTRTTKHPWLMACDANMSPQDFEKKPLVSKRANVRDGTRRTVNVQIKECQRRLG